MKNRALNVSLLLLLLQVMVPCYAQRIHKGQILVKSNDLKIKNDSLFVDLDFDIRQLTVDSDRSLELTPVLVGQNNEYIFPSILINGKKKDKVYSRDILFADQQTISAKYKVVKSGDEYQKSIKYIYSIKKEEWMSEARLDIKETLCGCAGNKQETSITNIVKGVTPESKPVYEMKLAVSYIKPQNEEVKRRSEEHQAYLDFPVAKTVILPEFGNNPQELARLLSVIDNVEKDKNINVTNVEIVGYASPEGSVKLNNTLSKGRAESLKKFLISKANFASNIYTVKEGGEDWTGLTKLLETSDYSDRESIISIIKYNSEESRKQKLKQHANGTTYKQMLTDLYPRLRRVVSVLKYTVRGFNVEEAKEIIKTRPQLLSLEEMFMVANTYNQGSELFSEVFEIAVRLYPDNEIANLNAAASALLINDFVRAEKYLERSDKTTSEYLNNQAIYHLQKEEYQKAEQFLNQAINAGSKEALNNLQEMKKKLEK